MRDLAELRQVPAVPCPHHCHLCCLESPAMSWREWQVLPVKPVYLRGKPCVFLIDKGCSIYTYRPTLCRLYGTCAGGPHACQIGVRPPNPLPDEEVIRRWQEASAHIYLDVALARLKRGEYSAWLRYLQCTPAWPIIDAQVERLLSAARPPSPGTSIG